MYQDLESDKYGAGYGFEDNTMAFSEISVRAGKRFVQTNVTETSVFGDTTSDFVSVSFHRLYKEGKGWNIYLYV